MTRATIRMGLAALVVCLTAVSSLAQQETTTVRETKSFEIIAVDGHQLVVKLPEGTRELTVPDDFRFTVNGQSLSLGQLKPGLKGTAVITTRTTVTPVTVTEVKSGTVMKTSGSTLIVRTSEGVKSFAQGDIDKRGVKIMREGKPAQLSDFREGDQITATIITSKPPQVLSDRQVQAYVGTAPPAENRPPSAASAALAARRPSASAAPSANSAAAPASPVPAEQSASAGGAKTLPKTASSWPLLGLTSLLLLAMGLVLTIRRRCALVVDLLYRVCERDARRALEGTRHRLKI